MSDYDPTVDPRYVPIFEEMPEVERERVNEHLAELHERIVMFDQILLVFQQPGWGLLVDMHKLAKEEFEGMLVKEHDPIQWKFYRGQLAQIDAFLDMPAEIAKRQRGFRHQFDDLTRLVERSTDE